MKLVISVLPSEDNGLASCPQPDQSTRYYTWDVHKDLSFFRYYTLCTGKSLPNFRRLFTSKFCVVRGKWSKSEFEYSQNKYVVTVNTTSAYIFYSPHYYIMLTYYPFQYYSYYFVYVSEVRFLFGTFWTEIWVLYACEKDVFDTSTQHTFLQLISPKP